MCILFNMILFSSYKYSRWQMKTCKKFQTSSQTFSSFSFQLKIWSLRLFQVVPRDAGTMPMPPPFTLEVLPPTFWTRGSKLGTWKNKYKGKQHRQIYIYIFFVKYMFQAVSGRVAFNISTLISSFSVYSSIVHSWCPFWYTFERHVCFWEFRRKGPSVVDSGNRTSSAESLGTKQLFTDVHREPKARILKHLGVRADVTGLTCFTVSLLNMYHKNGEMVFRW